MDKLNETYCDGYARGYDAGHKEGFEKGKKEGYARGVKHCARTQESKNIRKISRR